MSGPFKRSPRNLTRSPRKRSPRNLMRSPRNLLKSIRSDYGEDDKDEDGRRPEMIGAALENFETKLFH